MQNKTALIIRKMKLAGIIKMKQLEHFFGEFY